MKFTLTDLVGAMDDLTSAVEGLDENGGGCYPQPAPITELLKTLDAARSLDGITPAEMCELADRRGETVALLRRFGSRLRWAVGSRQHLPDPGSKMRPTAAEAFEADRLVYAVGALLRISEWVERLSGAVQARGSAPDDI